MMREFKANPFELSVEEMRAKRDVIDRQREEFYAEHGAHGSDGVIIDALSDTGNRWMDNTEEAILGAIEGLQNLGTLAICAPGIIRDKLSGK